MSNPTWKSLGLAALVAGGASVAAMCGASAATLPVTPSVAAQTSHHDGNVVLVRKKKQRHYRDWHEYRRHHGGHRYRHRRPGYHYYYHGYYYARPWWTLTFPGVVVAPAPGVVIQFGN